jgi:outer membrane protein insertion porin family
MSGQYNYMKRLAATFCVALVMIFGSAVNGLIGPAYAQQTTIQEIRVVGNQRIEASTVLSYMTVRPGDAIDDQRVDRSLKSLFATGLFADVTLERDGGILVVRVQENPIINRVVFEGNSKLDSDDFEKEIQLKPRVVYTRARVQTDVQRMIELYRRKGRFAATIEPKVIQLPQNRVDLVFEINEGPVTGVRRINFLGNKRFSDSTLRDTVATKESRWWRLLTSNDNYDPDRLTFDREVLRRHYIARGYADFRVVSAVAELTRDREDFFITITVDEGNQYTFGEVDVISQLEEVDPAVLRKLIEIKPGRTYDASKMDDTIDALTFAAGTQGFAFVDVRPRVTRDREARTINIIFEVNEGPRVYIEKINIAGNVRTLDRVIRREFRLVEGDAFNRVLIDRSKSRIRGLGFFKEVEITEEPGSTADKTVLNVEVEEQPTGELSVGAGFSSTDSIIGDLKISERNLLGRGQFLQLRFQISGRRQLAEARFTEPRFLGRQLAAGFDIYKTRTDFEDESGFKTDAIGVGLRFGFPITEHARLSPRYTLRQDDLTIDSVSCALGFIAFSVCDAAGETTTSLIGFTYFLDHRDDPIEPTRGYDIALTQDLAGVGGTEKYLRTEGIANYYYPIDIFEIKDIVANVRGSAGYIFPLTKRDIRLNDRFFKGGPTFRGFETSGIGARDTRTNDALGGEAYVIGTASLSFPLGLPEEFGMLGAIFADVGAVGMVDDSRPDVRDDFALRLSVGVGVYWDSPFGPIRIDFANPLIKQDYDQEEAFRFSAGTRF